MTETQERPGSAYVPSLEARLTWTGRLVTIHGEGFEPDVQVRGVQLAADVAETLAVLGVLAGEEQHQEITDDDIRRWVEFLHRLLPIDSVAARRYPKPDDLLRGPEDIAFAVPAALQGAHGDADIRAAVRRAERLIVAWMAERDG